MDREQIKAVVVALVVVVEEVTKRTPWRFDDMLGGFLRSQSDWLTDQIVKIFARFGDRIPSTAEIEATARPMAAAAPLPEGTPTK